MAEAADVINEVRSGVVRFGFYQGHDEVANGSGFLSPKGIISNSHVLRDADFDAVEITFGDSDSNSIQPIRLAKEDLYQRITSESPKGEFDYAALDLSEEPELAGRFNFDMAEVDHPARVGDQMLFFGFPLRSKVLTSHVGVLSADYWSSGIHRLQIDGSVNLGNSGGPLLHLGSGKLVGIVTLTHTGLEGDFDELIEAVEANERILSQQRGTRIIIAGLDPVETARVTMTALRKVARNLKRSANVGIGWAFCVEHLTRGI